MAQTVGTPATSAAAPARPVTSLALRARVIGKVALLRRPATAADVIPDAYAPSTDPSSPSSITQDDLRLARKLPGVASTWVVPLQTGALALVTTNGGAQFAPEQLDAGGVVQVVYRNGSTTVAGVVADGTREVSIETSAGATQRAAVIGNAYARTFDAKAAGMPTAIVHTTESGARGSYALSGNASNAP